MGLVVAVGCALTVLGVGLGSRFEFWHYRAGIATLANVFWVAARIAAVRAVAAVLTAPCWLLLPSRLRRLVDR